MAKHVILSDLHIPFHDPAAISAAIARTKREKPVAIHLLGDICDFYAISRFLKEPERKLSLQGDLDNTKSFLFNLRRSFPKADIVYSQGNHEARLTKYLQGNTEELSVLRCLDIRELLGLKDLKISYVPEHKPYRVGRLLLTHGQIVRKHSGYSAKAHFDKFGCSVLHGHTHRLGTHYHTDFETTHVAAENGCLCSLDPEYAIAPDWQHGCSIVSVSKSGNFSLHQVPIVGGEALA